jgi:hypothetical protein
VFDAVRGNPERDDEAMLAHVHAVEQQGHQVQVFERRRLPGLELRARPRDKAPADSALARAPTRDLGPSGSGLRAYCRVATPTSICSTTRRSSGSVAAIV